MKTSLIIFLSIMVFLVSTPIAGAGEASLKKATFIPQWEPQAQFAGYYMALEKGFYKKNDIDLTILTGGPSRPSADLLRDKKVDFATIWLSTAIQMRSKGIRIVNIGQMMQRSALMLVAKKKSRIKNPWDMDWKKVGLWGDDFRVQPRAFFKKYNITPDIIEQAYTVNLFLRDGVDVASAMYYNEYDTIINAGIDEKELVTFFFHDHGLNFPEDGIYTLEETFKEKPDLCKKFVKASIEGWEYAFKNKQDAVKLVLKNLRKEGLPAQWVHQKWMLEKMEELMRHEGKHTIVGKLHHNDFQKVVGELKALNLIHNPPRYGDFYRKCYADD